MATATQRANGPTTRDQSPLDAAIAETKYERTDLLRMKMENETFMAECKARPRDMEDCKRELTAQLNAFPDLAATSIYVKPVGKDEGGRQKFARGLSIRAAEVLAEVYGFNRVDVDVNPIDENTVKVEATFVDFQRVRSWSDRGLLSKWYKARRGGMTKTPDDRFNNVVVKAEVSRRVREVVLRSVNAGLKGWYENECAKIQAKTLKEEDADKIVAAFRSNYSITLEQIEALLGDKPKKLGWTQEDRLTLMGIHNALKDGETTVAELLAAPEQDPTAGIGEGDIAPEDLTGAKAEDEPPREESKSPAEPEREPGEEPDEPPSDDAPTEDGPAGERVIDALCKRLNWRGGFGGKRFQDWYKDKYAVVKVPSIEDMAQDRYEEIVKVLEVLAAQTGK